MIKTIPITIVREIVLTDDSFVIINKSFHSLLKLSLSCSELKLRALGVGHNPPSRTT